MGSPSSNIEMMNVSTISDDKLMDIIKLVKETYNKFLKGKMRTLQLEHEIMREDLDNKEYGKSVLKHLVQNSSLLGHLAQSTLLGDNTTYVEFGSGRGALSYHLTQALANPGSCDMVLVDRASPRHKLDTRTRMLEEGVKVTRLRVDIGHLHLGSALEDPDTSCPGRRVVGVSKHLCGAATDLTIRCLTRTLDPARLGGLMVALCCHHRCDLATYVGTQFLLDQGFSESHFNI